MFEFRNDALHGYSYCTCQLCSTWLVWHACVEGKQGHSYLGIDFLCKLVMYRYCIQILEIHYHITVIIEISSVEILQLRTTEKTPVNNEWMKRNTIYALSIRRRAGSISQPTGKNYLSTNYSLLLAVFKVVT